MEDNETRSAKASDLASGPQLLVLDEEDGFTYFCYGLPPLLRYTGYPEEACIGGFFTPVSLPARQWP